MFYPGFLAGGGSIGINYADTMGSGGDDQQNYNYGTKAFSTYAANRTLVACVSGRISAWANFDFVAGGVHFTQVARGGDNWAQNTAICIAPPGQPAGTSGTCTMYTNATTTRFHAVMLIALYGVISTTPYMTATTGASGGGTGSDASSLYVNVSVPPHGMVIGCAGRNGSTAFTWSNMAELQDTNYDGRQGCAVNTNVGNYTIGWTSSSAECSMVAAVFR